MGNRNSNLGGDIIVRVVVLHRDIHVRLSGSGVLSGLSRNYYSRRTNFLEPGQDAIDGPTVEQYSFVTRVTVEPDEAESCSDYESSISDSEVIEN